MDLGFGGDIFCDRFDFGKLFLGVEHFFEGLRSLVDSFLTFFGLLDIAGSSLALGGELFYPTHGIDEFLSTGDERVTLVTHVDVEGRARTTDSEGVATGTSDDHLEIIWVNILFHSSAILPQKGPLGTKKSVSSETLLILIAFVIRIVQG